MPEGYIYLFGLLSVLALFAFFQYGYKYIPTAAEKVVLNRIGNLYDPGTRRNLAYLLTPPGFYLDGNYQERAMTASFRFTGRGSRPRRALYIETQCNGNADLQVSDYAFADAMFLAPGCEQVQLQTQLLPQRCQDELLPEMQKLFLEQKIESFHLLPVTMFAAAQKPGARGATGKNLTVVVDAKDILQEPMLIDGIMPTISVLAQKLERLTGAPSA